MDTMGPAPSAAPPRRGPRRWRRPVLLTLLFLVLACAGGILYFVWSSSSDLNGIVAELDRQDPGWRLGDIEAQRRPVPRDKNSALHIMAIRKLMGGQEVYTLAMDKMFDNLPPQKQLNEQQEEYLRGRFGVLKKAAAEARKLQDMPDGRFPITYSADFFGTITNCQEVRGVCLLLEWDAARRVHAGDVDGAMELCLALQHAARAMGDEPLLISQLARYACNSITVGALERTLAQAEVSPTEASLKRMQTALEREWREPTFLMALRGERAGCHQFLQGIADGKFNFKNLGPILGNNPVEVTLSERVPGYLTRQHAAMLRYLNSVIEAAKLPSEERKERLDALKSEGRDEPSMLVYLKGGYLKVGQADLRTQANLRCAGVALAAERYHRARKHWPESLAALVKAGFLTDVPSDPYDGKPLRLKRTADGLAVYSVGPDRIDNDGNIDREEAGAGTDLGFRLWDISRRRQPPNPPVVESNVP